MSSNRATKDDKKMTREEIADRVEFFAKRALEIAKSTLTGSDATILKDYQEFLVSQMMNLSF